MSWQTYLAVMVIFPKMKEKAYSPTSFFSGTPGTHRDHLVHLLRSAHAATKEATVDGTKTKRFRAWARWTEFFAHIGLRGHEYLEPFSRTQRHELLMAFGSYIREGFASTRQSKC